VQTSQNEDRVSDDLEQSQEESALGQEKRCGDGQGFERAIELVRPKMMERGSQHLTGIVDSPGPVIGEWQTSENGPKQSGAKNC
jgi:hypothetical protein